MRKPMTAILCAMLALSGAVAMAGSGARGAEAVVRINASYVITNVWELQNMSLDLTGDYSLANDIDADITKTWNTDAGFAPIGDSGNPFTGSLNGQGYNITGLFINRTGENYIGLFGFIGFGGFVNNVSLIDVNASGSNVVGGFAGQNDGTITNCHSAGNASGTGWYVGGFAGQNFGTITNCYSTGNVSSDSFDSVVGGLVGYNGASITNCSSNGNISVDRMDNMDSMVGGLVGKNEGTVLNSHSTGNVSGDGNYLGGLVGFNSGTVANSSSTGNASCDSMTHMEGIVGGLVGYNYVGGSINNCSSIVNTSANSVDFGGEVGGLVGRNKGTITNSSSTGNASCDSMGVVGALVGYNLGGTITNCSSTGNASGVDYVGGLAGFNWATIDNCSSTGNAFGTGSHIGALVGCNRNMISNSSSTGNAIGVYNVGGLVGHNYGGSITNSSSIGNANGHTWVGGLAGFNSGSITRSSNTGNADGKGEGIGGLAGYNSGSIMKCSSTGNNSGNSGVGGFAGNNTGTITDCYSTGNNSGNSSVGGFAGNNTGTITDCYSTGNNSGNSSVGGFAGNNTGTITGCFWDNETSGWTTSDGGNGRNTAEMKSVFTYIGAAWNFENVWAIRDTLTYPFFGWSDWNIDPTACDDAYTILGNGMLNIPASGVLANDEDMDESMFPQLGGYDLSVAAFDNPSAMGAVVAVNADGSFSYDPTTVPVFQALAEGEYHLDTFTYTVSDDLGGADTATVTVNVTGVNDGPTANDDFNTTNEDTMLNVPAPGVLANDLDPDTTDVLSVVADAFITTNGAGITLTTDGGFTYDPTISQELQALAVGEFAHDSFTYMVDDGNGGMDTGKVTVNVTGANDAPGITSENVPEAIEGVAYSVDYTAFDIDATDTHAWAVTTNASWLTMSAAGTLSGIPEPGIFYVNVTVSDGHGGSDRSNFTLTAYADSNGNGIADFMDPDFLTNDIWHNETIWINETVPEYYNTTVWNNETVPEYYNSTVWNNQTIPEYHNTTVWSNGTAEAETPMWAWGAIIAAVAMGAVAVALAMRKPGGKKPEDAPEPEDSPPENR